MMLVGETSKNMFLPFHSVTPKLDDKTYCCWYHTPQNCKTEEVSWNSARKLFSTGQFLWSQKILFRLLGRQAINGLYILCAHSCYGGTTDMETPTSPERKGMRLGHEIRALFCCLFKLHGVQLPAKYICLKS